jgi:hypothetical protein
MPIVRVCQAIFGLITSVPSAQTQPYKAYFWFIYTFLWDLGLLCIVVALLRSLFATLKWRRHMALEVVQSVWAFILFIFLTIGSAFAGLYAFSANQDADKMYNNASQKTLGVAFAAMCATLLGMAAGFGYALVKLRRDRVGFSSADMATSFVFFPYLALLAVRMVPDMQRIFLFESPTLPVFIGMELAPELVLVALSLYTAHMITHWHFFRAKEESELHAHKKEVWAAHLDDAISYAQAIQQKGSEVAHRKKPWILFVAETRLWNGDDPTLAELKKGSSETVAMLRRLKGLSAVIADNLVLELDARQALTNRKPARNIDMRATERRVAEVLPKIFETMATERAAKVARDWVIIFVLDWRTLS